MDDMFNDPSAQTPPAFTPPSEQPAVTNISDDQSRTTATLAALPSVKSGENEAADLIDLNHQTIQAGQEAVLRAKASADQKQEVIDNLRSFQTQVMKTGPITEGQKQYSLIDFMQAEQAVDSAPHDPTALEGRGVAALHSWTGLDKDQDAMVMRLGSEQDQALSANTKLQVYNRTVDELETADKNRPWYERAVDAVTGTLLPEDFVSRIYAVPGKGSLFKLPSKNWNDQVDAIWDPRISPAQFKTQIDGAVTNVRNSFGVHRALEIAHGLGTPIQHQDTLGYNIFQYSGPAAYVPILKLAKMAKYASGAARLVGNRALSNEIVAAGLEGAKQGKLNPIGGFQPVEASIADSLPSVVVPDTLSLAHSDVGIHGDVVNRLSALKEATARIQARLSQGERIDPMQLKGKIEEEVARIQTEYKDSPVVDIKRDSLPAEHITDDVQPKSDTVRLYRGETDKTGDGKIPDYVKETDTYKATLKATGRWFTRSRDEAIHYNQVHGDKTGRVSFVDIPAADADKYLSANQPEAKKFSADGREHSEYFLPRELADSRKPLSEEKSTPSPVTDIGKPGKAPRDFVKAVKRKAEPEPKPYAPSQEDLQEFDPDTLSMLNDHGELRPVKVDGAPVVRAKKAVTTRVKRVAGEKTRFTVDDDTDLDNISHFNARGEIYPDVPSEARTNPFLEHDIEFANNPVKPLKSEDLDIAPQFRIARKMPDGTIKIGEPGQIHADLLNVDDLKSGAPGALEHMGFVDQNGKYYTRTEASEAIGRKGFLESSELKDIKSGRTAEVEAQIKAMGEEEKSGKLGGIRSIPELQRFKETGLYALKFFVGKDQGGGFLTREGAEAAAVRKGLDPAMVDIKQTVDGHWFVGVTHPIPETGVAMPQLSKDAFPSIWRESQFVKSLDSLLPEQWNELRLAGVLKQSVHMKQVVKPWAKNIERLNGPETKTLSTVLGLSERERKWYTLDELHQKYTNVAGRFPNDKEVMAYYSAKELSDMNYHIFNHNLYIQKARRGLETVSLKNPEIKFDTGRTNGRIVSPQEVGGERLFHLEDGQWSNGVDKDTRTLLDTGHYKIVALEDTRIRRGNEPVKYVVAHQDSMTHGPLEYQQLPYVEGGSRENANKWFVKQAVHGQFDDGTRYWLDPLTHVSAPTKKSAERWARSMEEARLAYISTKSEAEKRLVIDRSPVESYDKFDQMVKDGKISPNTPFETLFDREQTGYMNKHIQRERDKNYSDPSKSGREDYYITKGRMYYSEKGEHLKDPDGMYSEVLDPLTTLHKAVLNASRTGALADYNTRVVEEWARLATPYLEERSYGLAGDPWDKFFNGRLSTQGLGDTDKAFVTNLDVARNSHKRFMNMRDPSDGTVWRAGKALGQWLENRGSAFGDRLAQGVYNHLSDDPVSAIRSLVFQSYFGFGNLGRFVLHSTQAFAAISVHPVYGMKAFAASPFTWFATAVNRSDRVLDYIARHLGPDMGMHVEDYKHMVQSLRYSGWMDVGGEMAQLDRYWNSWGGNRLTKIWEATKDIGTMPFHAGIKYQRMTAYQIAWQVAREKMPTELWSSTKFQNFVNRYADRLSGNMTTSSQAYWQKGALSIPTTYLSWQARQLENMLPKTFGGSPHWTSAQRARLVLGQAVLYGASGVPLARELYDTVADLYREHTGRQIDPDTQRTFVQGMFDTMLHAATGNDTDFAHRAGVGEAFDSLSTSLWKGEWNSFLSTLGGPLLETGIRSIDSLGRLVNYMKAEQTDGLTKEQFMYGVQDVLPIVQGFKYDLQAWWAFKYGYIKDMKTGQPILDANDPNFNARPAALTEALGIPMIAETQWPRYLRSDEQQRQDIDEVAKAIAKVRRDAFAQYHLDHDEKAFERNLNVVRVLFQPWRDKPLMSQAIARRANDLQSGGHTTSEWNQLIMRQKRSTGLPPAEAATEGEP